MQDKDDERRDYFRRIDPLRVENAEDVELAYRLQNTTRMDPDLLQRIVARYAGELYRWIRILLYYQHRVDPTHEAIYAVLQMVLIKAGSHIDQFQGQLSALTWLFAISYQVVKWHSFTGWLDFYLKRKFHRERPSTQPAPIGWGSLNKLPKQHLLP